jgi:DNA-binding transcriptional LysR family regulator
MHRMEIRQLEIFLALAKELHFTRAAERVHCVQSNVTTQIRALEDQLGNPLFDRLAKRVTLTDAGKRFLPYAERALSLIEEARRIATANSVPAGALLIGSSQSMLTYRLPGVLSAFRKRYPEVELSFRPYLHEGLVHSIESGKLDLAVCMVDTVEEGELKSLRLRTEKLLFIVRPKDSLATKRRVRPQDFNSRTLLVTEVGCAYRKKLDQLLSSMNIRATSTIEFSSVEAIKECVSLGMGVALLPEIVVAEHLVRKRLKALRWVGPETDIATHVVWHKDKWISPALGAFIAMLQSMICAPPGRTGRAECTGAQTDKEA